jgi:dienelactone hydrolase
MKSITVILLLLLSAPGCRLQPHIPVPGREVQPVTSYSGFEFSPEFKALKVGPTERGRSYKKFKVEFDSDHKTHPENDRVHAECYLPAKSSGKTAGILVFPILSGGEPLSRGIGKALARAGFVALVLDQKEELFDPKTADMKFTDAVLRQAVSDARKAINWLEQRDDIDPKRIGCAGISMGGILACLVDAVEPRVSASVWLLAGGDLLEILAVTREPGLRKARENWLKTSGTTVEKFLNENRGKLIGPLKYAAHIDPAHAMMVTATLDRVIPRSNADRLWEATGRPARRLIPLGHFTALMAYPLSKRWVVKFFRDEFGGKDR